MRAYDEAGERPGDHPELHRADVHEQRWHRAARHAAGAGQPAVAAAAGLRAQRPLPPDLRADEARRGRRHPRLPGRGAGAPRDCGERRGPRPAHRRRARARRGALGVGGLAAARPSRARGAAGINVGGRRLAGPVQGFGRMWQKTYRVALPGEGAGPADLIAVWKERFAEFWPERNTFYAPLTGIAPGEVALLGPHAARAGEALDRGDGALRRPRVVHADDARGPHVRRLDHLQRERARRADGRAGAGPHARVGPDLRARPDLRRPPTGGPLLAADAHAPGRRPRPGRRAGGRQRRVRGPPAAVVAVRQRVASAAIRSALYTLSSPMRRR